MGDLTPAAGARPRPRRFADGAASMVAGAVALSAIGTALAGARSGAATELLTGALGTVAATAVIAFGLSLRQHGRVRALRRQGDHLRALAALDPLTMLANRRSFDEALPIAWRAAARAGRPVSLILIDADHFKAFNDRFGHLEGDGALRALAAALRAVLRRPDDRAFRIGGEEFAVLLPGTDAAGAALVAAAVRAGITRHALRMPARDERRFTVSMGVAQASPVATAGAGEADTLFAAADRALYGAKGAGRDRIRVAAPLAPRSVRPATGRSTVDGVEVVLPSGRVLRISRTVDLATLRAILGLLTER